MEDAIRIVSSAMADSGSSCPDVPAVIRVRTVLHEANRAVPTLGAANKKAAQG
jgi:hypothetical protein